MTVFASILCLVCFSQTSNTDSLKLKKDSTIKATFRADSIKIEKEFAEKEKWEKLKAVLIHPVFSSGEFSGVVPVKDPTEVPDPNMDYKLLFELTSNNPDSLAKDFNAGLVEVTRVINLHVASGVPLKKIIPVIVVHAGALNAFTNNAYYQEHYKTDNPNLKLIGELKNIGARFIACGQAMAFFNIKKENLMPDVKISITAQTVLSNYQLKGFVLYRN